MIALRPMRGAGIVQRGLRFGRPGGSVCLAEAPLGHRAGMGSWTQASAHGATSVTVHRNDDIRVPASSFLATAVLHGGRCLSSRSGGGRRGRGPTENRQRSSADAKDDAGKQKEKEAYTFLEEEDLGRLSSNPKDDGGLKTEPAPLKAAATEKGVEEQASSGNVTLWQRWKNARAKMKLLWKQYGLVWLGTYTVLYFGGLAGVYVILDTGLIPSDVDTSAAIKTLAEYIGAQDNAVVVWLNHTIKTNPDANTLLKAFIVNEGLEYPRDLVAIAATPSIARAIGRAPPKAKS